MAKMSLTAQFNLSSFGELVKIFPQATAGVLHAIGYEGRKILENNLLSGQYITLKAKPRDSAGRRTVNYKILNRLKGVRISAYPLNLHDPRRAYKKLSPMVGSQIDSIVSKYDNDKFQKLIDAYKRKERL